MLQLEIIKFGFILSSTLKYGKIQTTSLATDCLAEPPSLNTFPTCTRTSHQPVESLICMIGFPVSSLSFLRVPTRLRSGYQPTTAARNLQMSNSRSILQNHISCRRCVSLSRSLKKITRRLTGREFQRRCCCRTSGANGL